MSREIKFRCWDKWNSCWYDLEEEVLEFSHTGFINECRLYDMNNERFILMQFTGLKDKTGKEIYEGDILESRGLPYHDVIFRKGCFYLRNDTKDVEWSKSFDAVFFPHYKIIGNVYENPELLNQKP